MLKHHSRHRALFIAIALLGASTSVVASVAIKNVPVTLPNNVPGNLVLVPSVEWPTVVTQANDPAAPEDSVSYTVATAYAGYFNANLCYAYHYDAIEANRYFYPVVAANTNRSCAGLTGGSPSQKLWSGNFLNWVSMQAMDTFRLALTGGYRVHRPADGTPPSVSVIGSDLVAATKATSEMPDVTYLEKANSDRWSGTYTIQRRMTAADANVDDATPSSATTGFRTRIGALRNQMWFVPTFTSTGNTNLGNASALALALPVTDGNQVHPQDPALSAIPYNPTPHTLPDSDTVTVTSGTACTTGEYACSTGTPLLSCDSGYSLSGTNCTKAETKDPCPTTNRRNFRTGTSMCHQNNNNNLPSIAHVCPITELWVLPTQSGTGRLCTRTLVATPTVTPQYQRTTYGRNQVYAVSIRVKVCDGTLDTRDFCTRYGSNYKPEGLLQRNSKKIRYSLFSFLTETGQTRQGGVMRARQKLISPVSAEEAASLENAYPDQPRISGIDNPEWDPTTGVFINNPDTTDASATDANIGSCTTAPDGSGCSIQYSGVINYLNRAGQINTGLGALKSFDNLSEMYYTALRYLRGIANRSIFSSLSGTALADYQNADGLPVIEDWYKTGANTAVRRWNTLPVITSGTDGDPTLYQCQTSVVLGIGDTGTNNEDDTTDLTKDSVAPGATWRGYTEFTSGGAGQGNLAGLAYWAHLNDLRTDVPNSNVAGGAAGAKRGQTISTYWVDVVELNEFKTANRNQFYNTTKYGGYTIPDAHWNTSGNAERQNLDWFTANQSVWSSATQNVKTATGLGRAAPDGNYFLPNNMYLANNGQKMIDGLSAAFEKIADNLTGSGSSLAANSTKLDTGTTTYQATYVSGEWKGNLKAFTVNPSTGVIAVSPTWEAADPARLPTHANRIIKTCKDTCTGDTDKIDFKTANVTTAQRAVLGSNTAEQDGLINYLRGSAALEVRNGGTLRNRATPLGDIINSQPVFVSAPDPNLFFNKSFTGSDSYFSFAASKSTRKRRIYVAANDGMLHGFSAEASTETGQPLPGQETFAYLPNAVILASLKNLSSSTYGSTTAHQFYNDGELTVADVYLGGFDSCTGESCWRTVLVGTTGRGPAKAIYALDVTNPADVKLLWERDVSDSGYIGQIVGKPVIAQTANGVWSVLIGNGYNSTHNKPALLKLTLQTGALAAYETTGGSSDDGLAPPAVWIGNAPQNISTEAYAGDLNGNVWKFDLSTGTTGTRLYIAKNAAGDTQPITAGMIAGKNPNIKTESEVWVFFGTGRALQDFAPPTVSADFQTWYGLVVQGTNAVTSTSSRTDLRQRTIDVEFAPDTTRPLATRGISTSTANDMAGKKGWYINLLKPNPDKNTTLSQGERMTTPNQFQGKLLLGTSRVPADATTFDPCDPSGTGWVMAIDPFTGVPPSSNFFDVNRDGNFNSNDNAGGGTYVTAGVGFTAIPNNPIFVSNTMLVNFDDASTGSISTRGSAGDIDRLSWRELVVP